MGRQIFIGPTLNRMWFFSKSFRNSLELDEKNPILVIDKSKKLSEIIVNAFKENQSINIENEINGIVQFSQDCIFFYDNPEIMDKIASLSKLSGSNEYNSMLVYPIIHHPNNINPETTEFLKSIKQNFERTKYFGGDSIIIHFHPKATDSGIYQKTFDALTSPKFLDLVEKFKIYMQFENNHHQSYFGNGENIIHFYKDLDKKLEKIGRGELIPYFSFCFDYGHFITQMHMAGKNVEHEIMEFFNKFSDRIGTFHLHINDGTTDQHIIPINRDKIIIPKGYKRYDDSQIMIYKDILWRTLKYWVKLTNGDNKPIKFIFEINSPFTINQFANLGSKLGQIFENK